MGSPTTPCPRRWVTAEFKAAIGKACQRGDRSIAEVATDVERTKTAVRDWVKRLDRRPCAVIRIG